MADHGDQCKAIVLRANIRLSRPPSRKLCARLSETVVHPYCPTSQRLASATDAVCKPSTRRMWKGVLRSTATNASIKNGRTCSTMSLPRSNSRETYYKHAGLARHSPCTPRTHGNFEALRPRSPSYDDGTSNTRHELLATIQYHCWQHRTLAPTPPTIPADTYIRAIPPQTKSRLVHRAAGTSVPWAPETRRRCERRQVARGAEPAGGGRKPMASGRKGG